MAAPAVLRDVVVGEIWRSNMKAESELSRQACCALSPYPYSLQRSLSTVHNALQQLMRSFLVPLIVDTAAIHEIFKNQSGSNLVGQPLFVKTESAEKSRPRVEPRGSR